ncbi:lipase 3 isoform X5 [Nasonia vitripennis]|uniref:Uncharacterized protein n=1 Tax=Nasonia vitripennis TaxID=7425 RepID=A0A7M7HCA5_NASVI|nr:lipase 3 isoform X5 [Nasonia vitripennis]
MVFLEIRILKWFLGLNKPSKLSAAMQIYQVLPLSKVNQIVGKDICTTELGKTLCGTFLSPLGNIKNLNFTALPEILAYVPAGASINTLVHYHQIIKNGRFAKLYFGTSANPSKYGSSRPSLYNLSKVTSRQAIFYSEIDVFVNVTDKLKLKTN